MGKHTLAFLVPWIIAHGYFLFFVLALIEGSLVSTAAGVVAGLGYFNIFIVIAISISGDIVADVIYFAIGHYGRSIKKNRFTSWIGLSERRIEGVSKFLHSNTRKSLLFIKLSPLVGPPGLIATGALGVPFKKFFKIILIISVIKGFFFSILGFLSARTYIELSKFIAHNTYILLVISGCIITIYILYKKFTTNLADKFKQK